MKAPFNIKRKEPQPNSNAELEAIVNLAIELATLKEGTERFHNYAKIK